MTTRLNVFGFCLLVTLQSAMAQDWIRTAHDDNPAVAMITAALDEATNIDFIEVPLQDVVDYLADLHGIPIVIDNRALDCVGLGTDTPFTRRLEGISLRSALRLMLEEIELTFLIRDEVLFITTLEESQKLTELRVYKVADLLEGEPADHLAQTLLTILRTSGDGQKRGDAEAAKPKQSSPRIAVYRNVLIVRDTFQGHEEVKRLLTLLKRAIAQPEPMSN